MLYIAHCSPQFLPELDLPWEPSNKHGGNGELTSSDAQPSLSVHACHVGKISQTEPNPNTPCENDPSLWPIAGQDLGHVLQ